MKGSGRKPWRHLVAALALFPIVYLLWRPLESSEPLARASVVRSL